MTLIQTIFLFNFMEKEFPQRTNTQNRSIHKFCELLADILNDAGYDMKKTLKPDVDISWTKENVKKYLWKPIQDALYNKDSTTELKTNEVTHVYETLTRHLGQKLGIEAPVFPSQEEQMLETLEIN